MGVAHARRAALAAGFGWLCSAGPGAAADARSAAGAMAADEGAVAPAALYLDGWADATWAARRCYGIAVNQEAHARHMARLGLKADAFAADPAARMRLRKVHAEHEKQALRLHGAWCGALMKRFAPDAPAPGRPPDLVIDRR